MTFAPTDWTNLEHWMDAADTGSITNVANIATVVNDKSGHGRNLALSGAGPGTGVNTINGHNVLDFTGGQRLTVTGLTTPAGLTGSWCFVISPASANWNYERAVVFGTPTSTDYANADTCIPITRVLATDDWMAYYNNAQMGSSFPLTHVAHVITVTRNGANWIVRVDGVQVVSVTAGSNSAFGITQILFGDGIGGGAGSLYSGKWCECFWSSDYQSGSAITDAEAYLTAKWITSGGTTYTTTLSGSITPAGAFIRMCKKILAGSITPAGAFVRKCLRNLAGSITPAGTLIKQIIRTFSGSITPSGTLSSIKAALLSMSGSITPAGTFSKMTLKSLAGSVTPSGAFIRKCIKILGGTITPTGTITFPSAYTIVLDGVITPLGVLAKRTFRIFTGSITPAGTIDLIKNFIPSITNKIEGWWYRRRRH